MSRKSANFLWLNLPSHVRKQRKQTTLGPQSLWCSKHFTAFVPMKATVRQICAFSCKQTTLGPQSLWCSKHFTAFVPMKATVRQICAFSCKQTTLGPQSLWCSTHFSAFVPMKATVKQMHLVANKPL